MTTGGAGLASAPGERAYDGKDSEGNARARKVQRVEAAPSSQPSQRRHVVGTVGAGVEDGPPRSERRAEGGTTKTDLEKGIEALEKAIDVLPGGTMRFQHGNGEIVDEKHLLSAVLDGLLRQRATSPTTPGDAAGSSIPGRDFLSPSSPSYDPCDPELRKWPDFALA